MMKLKKPVTLFTGDWFKFVLFIIEEYYRVFCTDGLRVL